MPTKKRTKVKKVQETPMPAPAPAPAPVEVITAWKGFDKDWKCRGFQYEVGKTYTHDKPVVRCGTDGGFHACEMPLDIWNYYPPATSRFGEVEQSGKIDRNSDKDTKIASAIITIKAEISVGELIRKAVDWVVRKAKDQGNGQMATGNYGHAAATGNSGHAAATGYSGHAAATGNYGHAAATGYSGHAAATGDSGHAAATGNSGHAAATGNSGHAAATGYSGHAAATGNSGHAAATGNSGHAAATGDSGHAAATGDYGHAAATGYSGHAAATGYSGHAATKNGVAVALGTSGKAKAGENGAIVLNRWDEARKRFVPAVALVGENGIKPDTLYTLDAAGNFIEVA